MILVFLSDTVELTKVRTSPHHRELFSTVCSSVTKGPSAHPSPVINIQCVPCALCVRTGTLWKIFRFCRILVLPVLVRTSSGSSVPPGLLLSSPSPPQPSAGCWVVPECRNIVFHETFSFWCHSNTLPWKRVANQSEQTFCGRTSIIMTSVSSSFSFFFLCCFLLESLTSQSCR